MDYLLSEERFNEIRENYENACGVAYERHKFSRNASPEKNLDFTANEDMFDLIVEVERLRRALGY